MKLSKLIGVLAAAVCVGTIASVNVGAQTYEPAATVSRNGHNYALFDKAISWHEAKLYCESIGGHLVTITSSGENDLVTALMYKGDKNDYYIGAQDSESEGKWEWITGERWSYSNWGKGEPNNDSTGEDYLEITKGFDSIKSGEWNDVSNKESDNGFICEWESPTVHFPSFKITINGVWQNNARREYPFILYRDITYFPMTFDDCLSLGVVNIWNNEERCNRIYAGGLGSVYYPPQTQYSTAFNTAKAQYAPNAVYVNDVKVNNGAETYPILLYKNVLYFPLTWNWITSFGWNYTFDMTNGSISTIR